MDLRNVAVVEFDGVNEVVFAVSGYTGGVVEIDVDDFAGLAVEVVVRPGFFVEYEFDAVSFRVCVRDTLDHLLISQESFIDPLLPVFLQIVLLAQTSDLPGGTPLVLPG